MENKQYKKRIQQRKLNSFQEYKTSTFAWGASFLLFLIILISSIDIASGQIKKLSLAVSLVFLVSGIIQYLVTNKIRKEILKYDDIKSSTRLIGYFLIPFALTGNFFIAIAGFTLIKKEKTIEYTLCIY
ncbi:MAG: ABC transporter permease, partial [Gottschalkiaceae bacterium]